MHIDWTTLVLNLRSAGLSCATIARKFGMKDGGQYLNRIARGDIHRMEFYCGLRLLDLHLDLCRDKHEELTRP